MSDARYTHGHVESVLRSHRWRTAENSAAYLIPHLRPGLKLLDVGCGPGTITADLARLVHPGPVVAIDASAKIIAEASARFAVEAPTVEWRVEDVYELPFDDGAFDVVHAHQVMQHLPDPVAALVEMRRVTKPGGILAVRDADYRAFAWFPAEPTLDRWLELYEAVARANHGEPDAARHLLAWAHAAGLEDVTATATAWCYASPEDSTWWGELWSERATVGPFADRAVELELATREELEEIAAGWLRWAASPDAWLSIPNGELVCRIG